MIDQKNIFKVLLLSLAYAESYVIENVNFGTPKQHVQHSMISHESLGEELFFGSKQLAPTLPKKCPNETLIAPCVCTYVHLLHTELDLDCTLVSDEVELGNIFKEDFPNRHFRLLNMTRSSVTTIPKSIFGNHIIDQFRFDKIDFSHSALEEVEEDAFEHSKNTLTIVDMTGAQLTTFPFTSIEEFSALSQFLVHENQYSSIPPLVSSSLRDLTVGSPNLNQLPEITEGSLPNLQILDVQHSPLETLTPGQFVHLESLQWLVLHDVGLTTLEEGTFQLNDDIADSNTTIFIHVEDNNIIDVQADAIQSSSNTWVFLRGNPLSVLDQDVWQPLLDNGAIVDVFGLPVVCDCSLAWVVENPNYAYQLFNGVCESGKSFEDLDPSDFSEC